MRRDAEDYTVTLVNGDIEKAFGQLTIKDGVLWITDWFEHSPYIRTQKAFPLTSVLKWEQS